MSLKNFTQKIASPIVSNQSSNRTIGKVVKANDGANTCDIQYVDKEGNQSNKKDVCVKVSGDGSDWFPTKGELVLIEEDNKACEIVGKYIGNYDTDVKINKKLENDVCSNGGIFSTIAGFIM